MSSTTRCRRPNVPFPYVDRDRFATELQFTAVDFALDESDWNQLLDDALKAESERVEAYCAEDVGWRAASADVPFIVQTAVIRLARQRVAGIKEDGINSEDLVSGAGYDYRPPQALRDEVKQALGEAGYRTQSQLGVSFPEVK
ncbi:hypothetical protein SAMN04487947_1228 [Halogeometricum rufum]|uniref:Uncharacterized protein n=1 Tax=Halogeometricum rufum TaxID=553469 RepID=A0A1I6GIY0_9EURY|nr:hypothetical protein SAMN04487947_1228 [Halogeometricum rufum]